MLNDSLESDKEIDPERERQRLMLKRQKSIEESLQLSVKDHIIKLENYLIELKKELESSKKEMSNLRMDISTVKNNLGTMSDDLTIVNSINITLHLYKMMYNHNCYNLLQHNKQKNQAKRLLNETIKKSQDVQHDSEFLDAQLNVMKSDQDKLLDVTTKLEKRIVSCETDVGFKHVYD